MSEFDVKVICGLKDIGTGLGAEATGMILSTVKVLLSIVKDYYEWCYNDVVLIVIICMFL